MNLKMEDMPTFWAIFLVCSSMVNGNILSGALFVLFLCATKIHFSN